jgi:tetratricopeptide (TPR) repeat protein
MIGSPVSAEQRDVVVRTDSSATMATAALLDIRNAWAEAMLEKGDLKKAESTIADANSSGARLTLKDAGNSNWKSSLAVSRTVSGEIQAALHKPDQAIQSYQKAIEALNQLVLRSPEEIGLTRAQSWSHLLAGNAYKQMKADAKAREEWEQALAIIEPVALHVDDADVRDNYARALIALGQMERAQPICRELQEKGWNWKGFQGLCHTGGVALTVATR